MRCSSPQRSRASSQRSPAIGSASGTTQPPSLARCGGPMYSALPWPRRCGSVHSGSCRSPSPAVSGRPWRSSTAMLCSSACRPSTPPMDASSRAGACAGTLRNSSAASAAMPDMARSRLRSSSASRRSLPTASAQLWRCAASRRRWWSLTSMRVSPVTSSTPSSTPPQVMARSGRANARFSAGIGGCSLCSRLASCANESSTSPTSTAGGRHS